MRNHAARPIPHARFQRAMTILELTVVALCVGILGLLAVFGYQQVRENSANAAKKVELETMMRNAQALARSDSSYMVMPEHLQTAANEMVASSSGPGVRAEGETIIMIEDLPTGGQELGWVVGVDYGPSLSPEYASYMIDEATGLTGVAMRTTVGHCVFALSSGTDSIATWTVASDLGGECRGGNALAGVAPDDSYEYQDPTAYGAPDQVTGLTFVSATDASATVSWNAVGNSDLAGYKIYVDGELASGASLVTATEYTIVGLSSNSPYVVRVAATDTDDLTGFQSASITVITVPRTPTGLTATAVSGTQVDLTWDAQAYSTFRVYVNTNLIYTGTDTSYSFTSADPSTTYSFQIDATNSSGGSAISPAVEATTFPGTVADFAFDAPTSSQSGIGLTWTASSGVVSGYYIYRDSTDTPVATLDDGAASSYVDSGRTAGASHTYYISAYNGTGESALSSPVVGYAVPADPAQPSTSEYSTSGMTVSWTAVSGASSYEVYQNESLISTYAAATTSHAATGLDDGTNYSFQVKACNLAGCSGASDSHTAPTLPAAITDFAAEAQSSSATLTWTESTSSILSGYKIYYKTVLEGSYTLAASISGLDNYTVTGLNPMVSYQFKVASYNASGETDSSVVTATPYTMPDAPAAPVLSGQTLTGMDIAWASPASDGGSAITSYELYRNGTLIASLGASDFSYEDLGPLEAGTNFSYQVKACNIAGCSGASVETTAPTLPSAISGLSLDPTNSQIEVSWTDSTSTVLSGHKVFYRAGTSGSYIEWTAGDDDTSPTTVTGLSNGTSYEVYVAAYNESGATASTVSTATPRTIPGTPLAPTISGISQTGMTVSWAAPSSDGGSAITGYVLYRNGVLAGSYGSGETSAEFTGLTAGTTYSFQVVATNIAGSSGTSAAGEAPTLPLAPTGVSATAGYEEATLTWTDSTSAMVSGYKVYYREGSSGSFTGWTPLTADTSPTTLTGLTGQSEYTFKVAAYNASGEVDSTTTTATPFTIPGAPGSLYLVSATDTTITVGWSAPDDDGGNAITSYEVVLNASLSQSVSGSTLEHTFSLLDEGTNYSFSVRAQNGADWGPYGSSFTAPTTPAAISALTADPTDSQIEVSWTDSTSPVVGGYTVFYRAGTSGDYTEWTPSSSDSSPTTITGLSNGTSYQVYVAAYNESGSTNSSVATATPRTNPDAPLQATLTAATTSTLDVAWDAPAGTGGSAITSYEVILNGATLGSATAADPTYQFSSLNAGQTYAVQIKACNIAGCSGASSALNATTRPAAATGVQAVVAGPKELEVSWTDSTSSVVAGYKLYYRAGTSGSFTEWTGGSDDTSPTTVTGLVAGTAYYFRVDAYVNNGATAFETASAISSPVTAIDTPSAPDTVEGTAGNTTIALSWSSVSGDSSQPVDGYRVYYKEASSSTYIAATSTTNLSYELSALSNGTTYDVKVVSYNSAAESIVSTAQVSTTPYTAPAAPSITAAAASGDSSVSLTVASNGNGGSSITQWDVNIYEGGVLADSRAVVYTSANQAISIENLAVGTSGTTYTFKVTATNAAGVSAESSATSAILVYSTPSVPGVPSGTIGNGQIDASFTASSDNYGSAITGYEVGAFTSSTSTATLAGYCATSSTSCTIEALANGTTYYLRSRAGNAAGWSDYSTASAALVPSTTPDAPAATGSYAYANSGSAAGAVVVTIGIPTVSGNGSAVTSYTGEVLNGSSSAGTCTISGATGGTCNVSGLSPQVAYTIRSKATNARGDSGWYSIGSLTAIGKPTIGSFAISQTSPANQSNGGSQYNSYTISLAWSSISYSGTSSTASPFAYVCSTNTGTSEANTTAAAAASGASYTSTLVTTSSNGSGNTAATSRSCNLTVSGTALSYVKVGDYATSTTTNTYTSAASSSSLSLPGYAYPYPYPANYASHYPGHYPGHYPSHYPGHYPGHYPSHYPGHYPGHYPSHYPGHYPGHYPSHYPGHYPRHYPSHYPGHYPRHYPGHYPRHYPSHYPGHYPRHYPGHYPRHYPSQYYPPFQRRY